MSETSLTWLLEDNQTLAADLPCRTEHDSQRIHEHSSTKLAWHVGVCASEQIARHGCDVNMCEYGCMQMLIPMHISLLHGHWCMHALCECQ